MWDCWKELCRITTNVSSRPEIANKRMLVWKRLDDFLLLLRKQKSTSTYATDFQKAITLLIKSIKDAWGEKDITFYLVRLSKVPQLLSNHLYRLKGLTLCTFFWYFAAHSLHSWPIFCSTRSTCYMEYSRNGKITLPSTYIIFQEYKAWRWTNQKQCTERTLQLVLQKTTSKIFIKTT